MGTAPVSFERQKMKARRASILVVFLSVHLTLATATGSIVVKGEFNITKANTAASAKPESSCKKPVCSESGNTCDMPSYLAAIAECFDVCKPLLKKMTGENSTIEAEILRPAADAKRKLKILEAGYEKQVRLLKETQKAAKAASKKMASKKTPGPVAEVIGKQTNSLKKVKEALKKFSRDLHGATKQLKAAYTESKKIQGFKCGLLSMGAKSGMICTKGKPSLGQFSICKAILTVEEGNGNYSLHGQPLIKEIHCTKSSSSSVQQCTSHKHTVCSSSEACKKSTVTNETELTLAHF